MEYITEKSTALHGIECSLERQLMQGFKAFIHAVMGNKSTVNEGILSSSPGKRNYYFDKYQQILNSGKSGNVQVVRIRKTHLDAVDKNTVVYITFRLIAGKGVRLFNAVAMATKKNIPAINSVIPIFFNPDDPSLVVLL